MSYGRMNAVPLRASTARPPEHSEAPRPDSQRGADRAAPDFSVLTRGTASFIESLAGLAMEALVRKIDAERFILARAHEGSSWQADHRHDLAALERQLERVRAYEKAAQRQRMAPLSRAERDMIADAREADPDITAGEVQQMIMGSRP